MSKTPILSVVIPMFNGGETIQACLQSLLEQANDEVEILLVDDGSTDSGASLVQQEFSEYLTDGRLVLIQQDNQGASAARNTGLDHAQGRYVGFVDADDIVHPSYFSQLLAAISSQASDIIEFGYFLWDGQTPPQASKAKHTYDRFGQFSRSEIEREVFGASMWYSWTRIFHRKLFADIRFPPDVRFCEDLMTLAQIYPMATTVSNLPVALYYYRANPAGATMRARPDYVTQLTRYYLSIIDERGDCIDLLKGALQYCIYSCQQNMGLPYQLDSQIERDLKKVRRNVALYRYTPIRRLRVLLLPRLSRWLSEFVSKGRRTMGGN
jgi:hypothetical protein